MSEMLANQYFISERYFEALKEYSKLPNEMKNAPSIKEKMIICAALDEKFEEAVSLLTELFVNNFGLLNKLNVQDEESFHKELLNKLEIQNEKRTKYSDIIKMKMAILNIFFDSDKSLNFLKELKASIYADSVNSILQLLKKTK